MPPPPPRRGRGQVYNSFVTASDCGLDPGPWLGVYRVTEPWDQATVTWADQPAIGEGVGASFGVGHPACEDRPNPYLPDESVGIQRIDVTAMVTAWTRSTGGVPNYGIRLSTHEGAPHPTNGTTWYKDFCSMNPTTPQNDRAGTRSYFAPTLEVEFSKDATPLITGNAYGPPYAGGYPAAAEALEFLDSGKPAVWEQSKPYQRWLPDAYHSVDDATLKGADWAGGTSHKLRPGGQAYGDRTLLVTGDGASGFIGVVPYPSLAGYHWAINVKAAGAAGDLHGVELLPDGWVAAAFAGTDDGRSQGRIELYSRQQGKPGAGNWNARPVETHLLESAHEVLYDPAGHPWALGGKQLARYAYANGKLTNPTVFPLPKQPPTSSSRAA
ncbi:DNRLRE domain-containing protein [Streptomyces sp. NPDC094032]|uniref:DNRLRE domain-containing protein n=1 Tax=Streptomyces sp. NPDC094032 TaxID=3155308 RepID=UPI0033287AE7